MSEDLLAAYKASHFRFEVDDGVGVIILDRPERKNPLTFASYRELARLFRLAATDDSVQAFVIAGAEGNFCSGGDVHEIIGPLLSRNSKGLLEFTSMTGELVKAMRGCGQPIVAAMDGVAAGAGAIIAMASDIRLATPQCSVAFLFTRVGLAGCDMGACAMLPRLIGFGRASELLLTGRTMTAEEGFAWGFHNRIVAAEDLLAEAIALARRLARGPRFAHALTKRMLGMEWAMGVEEAIEAEAIAQALCMTTGDFRRAYEAFVAKRKPVFEGE